ncbi:unnamed protein product [Caenorhabditis bovis]|uniref:WD repeat domain-containing protein 83 n=1 Tax=Caenorhabditis bovis TaxID=2654633 RepID=A0A8S1F4P6_9PELO|nr:unnamed protein product [Caenorhabditis bovis]
MSKCPTIRARTIDCKQGAVRAVRYNVDGNYCITAGSDKTVKLWNPLKGTLLKTYSGTGNEVLDAASSSDNSQIAAGGVDRACTVFDVETGKQLRRWRTHGAQVNAVAFNEESNVVFSGSMDCTMQAFDVRSRSEKPIQIFNEATDGIQSIDVNGHEIVVGSADYNYRTYSVRDGNMSIDFMGEAVNSVHFTPDGNCVLAGAMGGIVRLMDKSNGKLLASYKGHLNKEYKLDSVILQSIEFVASGSEDGFVYIYNLMDSTISAKLEHPSKVVHSLSAHPKKERLITASGQLIYLWVPQGDPEFDFQQKRDDRCNGPYDGYDYDEDYGNQYANSASYHETYEEEEGWRREQQDFYDTVPVTKGPMKSPVGQTSNRNVARVQITTSQTDEHRHKHSNIPQAPPPPRLPTANSQQYSTDRQSKYGNVRKEIENSKRMEMERRNEVHIRFDSQAKKEFPPKQTQFIDGFRQSNEQPPKKKDPPANTIRSIINNLKGGNSHQENSIPRSRVSTNPFMRANQLDQHQQQQNRFEQNKQPVKNVAEVVEKMNNGDWPIRIEEEDIEAKKSSMKIPISTDKARQWETLHRKKDEKRSILERIETEEKQHEPDNFSEKSHEEEHTSVSTDSALCLDPEQRLPSPYKFPLDAKETVNEEKALAEEAEKLLIYFKSHREVLNYLGIGLSEKLWKHMGNLPEFDASIRIFKATSDLPAPPAPKITITPSFADRNSPMDLCSPARNSTSQIDPNLPSTDPPEFDDSRFMKNVEIPTKIPSNSSGGGRFVKKSAAALIAKKQGMTSEDPNSATEIIDPRIAEEIKNLQEREDELKRSRAELDDDIRVENERKSSLRSAQSYDHLEYPDDSRKASVERSQSSHNVYHNNPVESNPLSPKNHQFGYNYGSMPRTHLRQQDSQYQSGNLRAPSRNDGGYRQTRHNTEFFRSAPTTTTTNSNWAKSGATFEARNVGSHSGLQLPPASVSISTAPKFSGKLPSNPSGSHNPHRKIGL